MLGTGSSTGTGPRHAPAQEHDDVRRAYHNNVIDFINRLASIAHAGHHVRRRTSLGAANQVCRHSPHRHFSFVNAFTYVFDRHSPPRLAANLRISAIEYFGDGPGLPRCPRWPNFFRRNSHPLRKQHLRHQEPPITDDGVAFHSCPQSTHFHSSVLSALTYSSDKHFPPLDFARACIDLIECRLRFPKSARAHFMHHVPEITSAGRTSQECPAAHSNGIGVLAPT